MVIALNMYDELKVSGREFDHESLAEMFNIPIIQQLERMGLEFHLC